MTSAAATLRHPASVVLRLVLWPAAILGLGELAARTEDDALAGGLLAFAVLVVLSFLLALADGLVLRTRTLVLVWSVTTAVVVAATAAQPLRYAFVDGPEGTTWDDAVRSTLEDLPSTLVFFLVLIGVPVVLGAVTGVALRRSAGPRRAGANRSPQLPAPRA